LDDLDPDALSKARHEYVAKYPGKEADVAAWDDLTFLNKARLAIQGGITNTAILLLGRPRVIRADYTGCGSNLLDPQGRPESGKGLRALWTAVSLKCRPCAEKDPEPDIPRAAQWNALSHRDSPVRPVGHPGSAP